MVVRFRDKLLTELPASPASPASPAKEKQNMAQLSWVVKRNMMLVSYF